MEVKAYSNERISMFCAIYYANCSFEQASIFFGDRACYFLLGYVAFLR